MYMFGVRSELEQWLVDFCLAVLGNSLRKGSFTRKMPGKMVTSIACRQFSGLFFALGTGKSFMAVQYSPQDGCVVLLRQLRVGD